MAGKRIFVLEDDAQRIALFWRAGIGHDLTLAKDVAEAIKKWQPPYDVVCLDHDLGGEVYVSSEHQNTGAGFARWLAEHAAPAQCPRVVIHSYNMPGAANIDATLTAAGWRCVRWPFGKNVLALVEQPQEEAAGV